ncbi:MAG: hypothetical protein M1832_002514 [Thelocarpon impressellum]|nr:MAG: hypothetical protein M1832_002514 [Thelocarpon impressellum]
MRIRTPFAAAFLFLVALSAYIGLVPVQIAAVNDKVLHFVDFFLLTTCFYWVLDTSRRRNLNLTLLVCTAALGLGSEVVQGLLKVGLLTFQGGSTLTCQNGRTFDPYDIVANVAGSLSALGLSSWYHKRMLERRRKAKHYHVVPGDDEAVDLELGEGVGAQESGVGPSLEAQVDNWDENAEDNWDEEGPAEAAGNGTTEGPKGAEEAEVASDAP